MLLRIVNQEILKKPIEYYGRTILLRTASTVAENCTEPNHSRDLPRLEKNPYTREKKQCVLCKHNITPDYKNVRMLAQFQSQHTGMVFGRHITGLCKYQQKKVEGEIKKAQQAGLMSIWTKNMDYVHDPKLFDPSRPIRKHRF